MYSEEGRFGKSSAKSTFAEGIVILGWEASVVLKVCSRCCLPTSVIVMYTLAHSLESLGED